MANNRPISNKQNYYSNPAFCQQSELYNGVLPLTQIVKSVRQSPVGAQTPLHYYDKAPPKPNGQSRQDIVAAAHNDDDDDDDDDNDGLVDEQEFYEEMLVDDTGIIKEKKVLIVSSPSHPEHQRYEYQRNLQQKSRYEYIPMQEQSGRYIARQQRYAVIETNNQDIIEHHQQRVQNHRYEYIQDESSPPNRHHHHQQQQQQQQQNRYEYISSQYEPPSPRRVTRQHSINRQNPKNSVATAKLHELLMTPKNSPTKILSPQSQRRLISTTPQADPFITPKKSPPIATSSPNPSNLQVQQYMKKPKAQQKLNYALGARQMAQQQDKRHTAIVTPICSSPVQSVYSETTYSDCPDDWYKKKPTQVTLAVAALMMMLCGSVTSVLCFYMISHMGRLYFLDFGTVAGFTCLLVGFLGYRTRNCNWLPNRNYISGYIILSVFSLLMCAGLLVLLVLQPKPGTPLADMTSGAVCGFSVLSLALACVGVITSYCCKYPPPDNRVRHNVPGFRV